jgi:hypothetical protein
MGMKPKDRGNHQSNKKGHSPIGGWGKGLKPSFHMEPWEQYFPSLDGD